MVWVPELDMRSDFLGLATSLPRVVPSDAVVAVLDSVVPGMVLQKVVLLGSLVAGGLGAVRLVPDLSVVGKLAVISCLPVESPRGREAPHRALAGAHRLGLLAVGAAPDAALAAGRRAPRRVARGPGARVAQRQCGGRDCSGPARRRARWAGAALGGGRGDGRGGERALGGGGPAPRRLGHHHDGRVGAVRTAGRRGDTGPGGSAVPRRHLERRRGARVADWSRGVVDGRLRGDPRGPGAAGVAHDGRPAARRGRWRPAGSSA